MEATKKETRQAVIDKYDPELDNKILRPSEKLVKAKAYFQEHGVPDFDKIFREAEEKKTQEIH